MRIRRSLWILIPAALIVFGGCGDDDDNPTGPANGPDQIVLTLEHFGDPDPFHFALSAVDGGVSTLVTRFTVEDGAPVMLDGTPIPSLQQKGSIQNAELLKITLESDTSAAPSGPALLAGAVSGQGADLTIGNASAIGVDLTGVEGNFLFDTPTTTDPTDVGRGVWWTDGEENPGLNVPSLPSSWKYEGWVTDRETGVYYSTGRFSGPSGADSDNAGATAGTEPGHSFPGQDFVNVAGGIQPLDLDNGKYALSVTLEPASDLSDDPFFLTLLDKNIAGGNMVLELDHFPESPAGTYYAIWAVFPDSTVSIGSFHYYDEEIVDVTDGEEIVGFFINTNLLDADAVIISIESEGGKRFASSGSCFMGGNVVEDTIVLTYSHTMALGDLDDVTGSYILDTPTTPGEDDDSLYGFWFYEYSTGETLATLDLPTAPSGWMYEAWLINVAFSGDDVLYSIGTFTDPGVADSDGAGEFSDTLVTPPAFPGQDYVSGTLRQLVAGNYAVLISIEPEIDLVPGEPFLSLLKDIQINSANRGVTQDMDRLTGDLPSGSAPYALSRKSSMDSMGDRLPKASIHFGN